MPPLKGLRSQVSRSFTCLAISQPLSLPPADRSPRPHLRVVWAVWVGGRGIRRHGWWFGVGEEVGSGVRDGDWMVGGERGVEMHGLGWECGWAVGMGGSVDRWWVWVGV